MDVFQLLGLDNDGMIMLNLQFHFFRYVMYLPSLHSCFESEAGVWSKRQAVTFSSLPWPLGPGQR